MKSFADLKRSIRVGTRIICLSHWQDAKQYREPRPPMTGVIRTVQKAQGNGYFYHVPDSPKRMWADYPRRRTDLAFGPDETFTITFGELGTATFRILEENKPEISGNDIADQIEAERKANGRRFVEARYVD